MVAVAGVIVWLSTASGGELIPWVLASAAIGARPLLMRGRPGPLAHDLERHLAWARRRADSCDLLVVEGCPADAGLPAVLRTTDSAELTVIGINRTEVRVLLDDVGECREVVERRLAGRATPGATFGWARFPDDGVTVEALIHQARSRQHPAPLAPLALATRRA